MRFWRGIPLLVVALGAVMSGAAPQPEAMARLDEALEAVVTLEYGRDAGSLALVEAAVVAAANDPKRRAAVEQRLLRALGAASTRDGRSFLCRQLRTIGTARCVPQLEKLLTDAELSHMARYALGRIEAPQAVAALHRALGKTSGKLQAGIVNTLADRRCREALPDFVRLLKSPDATVAEAAVRALGRLGGGDAAAALQAARVKAAGRFRQRIDDALLKCAEHCLRDGRNDAAARIYQLFYSPREPKHVRIGALGGLVAARGAKAAPLLVDAIRSADHELRASAIALLPRAKGPEATKAFVALLPSLAPEGQELVLRALGARGDPAAAGAIAKAAESPHEAVRVAALEALGGVGDASTVGLLSSVAAAATGRPQQVARASLLRLRGDGVEATIVRSCASGDATVRIECIRALAGRGVRRAMGELFKAARDDDAGVRGEAIRALGTLAGAPQLAALVALVTKPRDAGDRPAVEGAITAAIRSVKDRDKLTAPVLAAMGGAPANARPALVRLLGRAATPKALASVREALKDNDAAVKDAAVRTLAQWPDASPAEDLLAIARSSTDSTHKVLVLRGYVRMAGLSKDPTAMYARAMALTERVEDRKLVLGGLGTAGSAEALKLVERYFRDEQLRPEAAQAAVRIADKLRKSDPTRAKAALKKVLALPVERRIRRRAQEIINDMEKYRGYVLAWLGCGPYRQKGKKGPELFDVAFAPEKPGAGDVKWRRLRRGVGAWNIDLEAAMGGGDHCAAYVRTRVWSPAEQPARLELGSDDSIKVWLNGKLVHANQVTRGVQPRQDLVRVELRKGWNELLLKVVEHEGGWGFCCRIRKPDGTALDGLRMEAK